MIYRAHSFIDGAYLRRAAKEAHLHLVDPLALSKSIIFDQAVIQDWCADPRAIRSTGLARVIYYDARPDDDSELDPNLKSYWDAIELLRDTQLGFGSLRGGNKKKPPRQKGVDTLIAVDMLVGAFTNLFSVALLVAGDADFVPIINEVRRRGVMVVVAGMDDGTFSDELKRSADRHLMIKATRDSSAFPPLMKEDGGYWTT
jgi:uncharacterized LabA/DUF88 family protein